MARPSERRAALANTLTQHTRPAADKLMAAHSTDEPEEEPTMKIRFTHIHLDKEIPRFAGGTKGLATSTTTFFDVERSGTTIELDTATQLVRLSRGEIAVYVPIGKVSSFGDTCEAVHLAERNRRADAVAEADAKAAGVDARSGLPNTAA